MGKTYKRKVRFNLQYRRCRGYKNAKINNARSIPPDGWSIEKVPCNVNYIPWKVAERMFDDGWPEYETLDRMVKKFKMSRKQGLEITDFYYHRRVWYRNGKPVPSNKTPDGYLKVWNVTRVKVNKYR